MAKTSKKLSLRLRRGSHVRKKITGSAERPRLSVFRSNKHIYAQVIDDVTGRTLCAASDLGLKGQLADDANKKDIAKAVGQAVAEKALAAGVQQVAFDRNGFKYHGRVASLADGAREAGLKF